MQGMHFSRTGIDELRVESQKEVRLQMLFCHEKKASFVDWVGSLGLKMIRNGFVGSDAGCLGESVSFERGSCVEIECVVELGSVVGRDGEWITIRFWKMIRTVRDNTDNQCFQTQTFNIIEKWIRINNG